MYAPQKKKDAYFDNLGVRDTLVVNGRITANEAKLGNVTIGGNLAVEGSTRFKGPVRFDGSTVLSGTTTLSGLTLTGDLTMVPPATINLTTITRDGVQYGWPTSDGPAGSVLTTNGSGGLSFTVPGGGGNVVATPPFTTNHAIPRTNTGLSSTTIEQTGLIISNANDLSVPGQVTASQFNGPLNGNATSATTTINFSGSLAGEVSGPQTNTVVNNIGTVTSAQIQSGVTAANLATNANTMNTIVKRNGTGGFDAGPITSTGFVGPLTGNVTGNATTATFATSSGAFSGSLSGDVSGTQTTTHVDTVGGQNYINIASATQAVLNATSNTTNNNLVIRDGTGNFAGAVITADTNFVGNLLGNATSATTATSSTTATNFTGNLAGNVTGTQTTTKVVTIANDALSISVNNNQIAAGIQMTNNATSLATPDTLVLRDGSGNFNGNLITANTVTINQPIVNPTDATTKDYVDSAVATGALMAKTPVVALADTAIVLTGVPQIIDSVTVLAGDRVLVTNQGSDGGLPNIDNGIWVAAVGAWTRPGDFANGTTAGNAYVVVEVNAIPNVYGGSSWLCNTPTATIGTDPIGFGQFSAPNSINGANVGTGVGVFLNRTGNTLNFKSLDPGTLTTTHISILDDANKIDFSTDGTFANTASTLVARDASGNFSAGTITGSLTGAASLNVLKSGDTMTGTLTMAKENEIRWQDSGTNYVGWKAPTTVPSSYTLAWPSAPPTTGQVLLSSSASTTAWATPGGSLVVSPRYIFVSKGGNDTTGNGTVVSPYLTVKKAVDIAVAVPSSLTQPIVISIGPGIFVETAMVIPSSAPGISFVGSSLTGTTIVPTNPAAPLFTISTPSFEFATMTLDSGTIGGSTSSAVLVSTTTFGFGGVRTLNVSNFLFGFNISSSAVQLPIIIFAQFQAISNGTSILASGKRLILENCLFLGVLTGAPANTAVQMTGTSSLSLINSSSFRSHTNNIVLQSASTVRIVGCVFENSTNDVITNGGTDCDIVGSSFIANPLGGLDVQCSGLGTKLRITGCAFEGGPVTPMGTAVQCTNDGNVLINSCSVTRFTTGLVCGLISDTITTTINADMVSIEDCTTDIAQLGTSRMIFNGGSFDPSKLSLANTLNCNLSGFSNGTIEGLLTTGKTVDVTQNLYQVLNSNSASLLPTLVYEPTYYSAAGTIYKETRPVTDTLTGTQSLSGNSYNYCLTGDNTKTTGVRLISDTSTFGVADNVRGWLMAKKGTSGNLGFNYVNSDTSGQAAFGDNTYLEVDGTLNTLNFPQTTNAPLPANVYTKLVWGPAGENTNMYRNSAGVVKTDSNLVVNQNVTVNGLTPSRAVVTNGSNVLTSSATTSTEIGFVNGVTSNIQTQLDSKVPSSGGTFTGNVVLPLGSAAAPSLSFTGFSGTGLSSSGTGTLQLSTAGINQFSVDGASGALTSQNLATGTAGIAHVSAAGLFSNSLIVGADITNNTIPDTKLQTISSAGKVANSATTAISGLGPNTIVLRDPSNNFSAGTITASLNGNATTATSATSATNFSGSLMGDVTGTQTTTVVALVGGVMAANVASGANLANAATNLNTASTIVRRDASGNFTAGTITANLNGNATTATSATTATNFTGPLVGAVTGTQGATALTYSQATATASTTTTSITPILLATMTLTPAAGTYYVNFSTFVSNTNNARTVTVSIFVGGVQDTTSIRTLNLQNANLPDYIGTQGSATVNGAQAIEIRWQTQANTATANNRTLSLLRTS